MTITNKITTLILMVSCSLATIAQVGIGTSTPNANSALEIVSTSQGMLLPRMTTAQRDAIASPATGLTIFNTDLNCIQTNISTTSTPNWKCFAGQPSTNGTGVVSAYDCSTTSAGTMTAGVAVSGVTQTITATVTTLGTYSISATTNGVTFAASGTFAGTGAQTIVLTATGTPTAAGSHSFILNTTPNCSFSRTTNEPSTNGTAIVSAYDCSTASPGTLIVGTSVSGVTQTITATVGTAGTYSISTTTANGVTFAGSGTFAGTGAQDIVLTATGTPTAAGTNSFTLNTSPNCSFSRTTITVPDAPTSPAATEGSASASVAFTAPAYNGGSTITGYTVTSSPGSFTATGVSSPLLVTGLTNGTSYTFTVVATNVVGNSVASTASVAVTPGPKLGSTFTAYSNGSQVFSANTTCTNKLISAQGCGGLTSVTGASSTVYDLVNINGQCWMKTNLNEVPSNFSGLITWSSTTDVGWNGNYTGGPFTNEGRLYQWSAAMNGSTTERAQGVCPTGFHIPSDCEWMYLEHGQGMLISEQTKDNAWRSTTGEGTKLRSVGGTGPTLWNNSSGFTALFAGNRDNTFGFSFRTVRGYWWSSSLNSTSARTRILTDAQAGVLRSSNTNAVGFSVRCLKD